MPKQNCLSFAVVAVLLLAGGCANPNVNPSQAQPNTGYVDLYSTTDSELCWEIAESTESSNRFRTVFSDVKPVEGDLLRLAFSPGTHRLRVTFLNRVVSEPAVFTSDVASGTIIPVAISLTPTGQTTVVSKQTTIGGTPSGRGGRQTTVNSHQTVRYDISSSVGIAILYQSKNKTHYTNKK